MRTAAAAGLGAATALDVYLRRIPSRAFIWGARSDEASRPMVGDERWLVTQVPDSS